MWYFQILHQSIYAPPISTSQGEEDEWLVYHVTRTLTEQRDDVPPSPSSIEHQSNILPSAPAPTVLAKPSIAQVYSRRQQTNDTCSAPVPSSSVPSSTDLPPPDPPGDLDLPIALRKGIRTCKSTYSIANFVSYDHLCPASRSLIVSLDSVSIPKTVKEALNQPGWSEAMLGEIQAL
uniref:Uncharacterized protein LOC104237459 n=1 Tax=Nicotiana sylvestris TaxID=4096 RepID=A0A1U7XGB4_NICSY|nr:PREDICTED: uncharacterized protein LOC104237459 [Nicotiana sylvestris]